MKQTIWWNLILFLPWVAEGQQLPYHTQYREFYSLINPAAVNSDFFLYEYNASIHGTYRAQWVSQAETPRTMHFSGEYISHFGGAFELVAGAMWMKDRTGPEGVTGAYGRVGSMFTRDPYFGAFSVALSFGMMQYRLQANRITWKDPDDPNIPLFDLSVNAPDIGAGIYYFKRFRRGWLREDNLYAGISVPQLMSADEVVLSGPNDVTVRKVPHVYGTLGWYHFFNENAFLEIGAWGKYVEGGPLNMDLSARFQPGRSIWLGAGFNTNGLVHLEGGLNVPGLFWDDGCFKIGYGFDYSLSAFGLPLGASHEINISYLFDTF